jgi:hypothetical protein
VHLEKLSVRIAIDCCSREQNESPACSLAAPVGSFDGWRSAENLGASNLGRKMVRQTVETCLHGLKFNDIESLKRAFHPEAKLLFVRKNGELGQLTQEQW